MLIMANIFKEIGSQIAEWYGIYSDAVHSVFPTALGDLVEYLLDIVVAFIIIRLIAAVAFGTKSGDN